MLIPWREVECWKWLFLFLLVSFWIIKKPEDLLAGWLAVYPLSEREQWVGLDTVGIPLGACGSLVACWIGGTLVRDLPSLLLFNDVTHMVSMQTASQQPSILMASEALFSLFNKLTIHYIHLLSTNVSNWKGCWKKEVVPIFEIFRKPYKTLQNSKF